MDPDTEALRSALRTELEYAHATVSTRLPLVPNPDQAETADIQHWYATLETTLFRPEGDGSPRARVWAVPGLSLDGADPEEQDWERALTLARVEGLTVDLGNEPDPRELVDALDTDGDYAAFLPLFLGPEWLLPAGLVERLRREPERVHILNRAEVAPAWRHLGGVGRLLTGLALTQLTVYDEIVLLSPFPLQHTGDDSDPGFAADLAAVQQVWASLGFAPWTDDVWFADTQAPAFSRAVDQLRTALLGP